MTAILGNFVVGVAATFIPLFIGLFIPVLANGDSPLRPRLLAAFSSGVMFWFFLDVMNDAVLLDVNQGFTGGFRQALLAGLFAASLLLLFGLERISNATAHEPQHRSNTTAANFSFTVAVLVALGIGFHAFGEGIGIGSLTSLTSNMIEATGGLGPGVAYTLHKLLEGFVIGTFAAVTKLKAFRVLVLGLVSGLPTILGLLLAISMPLNSTFFFALGGAATVYVEYKLIPNFAGRENMLLYVVASLLGFYSMYLAGLFHG